MRAVVAFVVHHARREPIAVLALLAATTSAVFTWQQVQINYPQVVFERLMGFGGPVTFEGATPETGRVSAETLHILNTGGRTATLTVLDRPSLPAFTEAVLVGGRPELRVTDAYTIEIGVLKEGALPHELQAMLAAAKGVRFERLEFPYVLDEPIDSGKAKTLVLVFRLRDKDGRLVGDAPVAFTCKARFGNGSSFDVFASFSGGP